MDSAASWQPQRKSLGIVGMLLIENKQNCTGNIIFCMEFQDSLGCIWGTKKTTTILVWAVLWWLKIVLNPKPNRQSSWNGFAMNFLNALGISKTMFPRGGGGTPFLKVRQNWTWEPKELLFESLFRSPFGASGTKTILQKGSERLEQGNGNKNAKKKI